MSVSQGRVGGPFDPVSSRLQGELQKSGETGAEQHNLMGDMNDIHAWRVFG